jgi:hypothetical protein
MKCTCILISSNPDRLCPLELTRRHVGSRGRTSERTGPRCRGQLRPGSRRPLMPKLTDNPCTEDLCPWSSSLSLRDCGVNGQNTRGILPQVFAIHPNAPGAMMSNDVKLGCHRLLLLLSLPDRGTHPRSEAAKAFKTACLPSSVEHRSWQSRRAGCSEPSPM